MTVQLSDMSESEQQGLIEAVCASVRSSSGPHYRAEDADTLRRRCDRLVREALAAAGAEPGSFVQYIRSIVGDRMVEGYRLEEIQTVLGILEEQLWTLCDRSFQDRDALLDSLRRVTTVIGAAKDELARVYLQHKLQADARVEQLQRKVDELFKGTDSMVDSD